MQALGVISRDYSSSGLHPAMELQPKHPGKAPATWDSGKSHKS